MARTTTIRSMGAHAAPRRSRIDRLPRAALPVLATVFGLLVLIGAGGVLLFGIGPAHASRAGVVLSDALGPLAPLPAMEFTLADDRRLHTVNLKVTLELPPGTDAEALAASVPRIATAVSSRLIEVQPSDLSGSAGTTFVKQQVSIAANRELRPLRVRSVMLQHFLVR
ncbi:hypothetical protein [Azospirillum sp. ST 5-10]|uniref:hypothetical protein n=1 Tax=unclassified Azospirillum TaxID=2630922 RepID=UPI003F4A2D0E